MTESLSRMPRDGKTYEPAFMLTGEKPKPGENPRAELARMLTEHIQFSRATVNWIWGKSDDRRVCRAIRRFRSGAAGQQQADATRNCWTRWRMNFGRIISACST